MSNFLRSHNGPEAFQQDKSAELRDRIGPAVVNLQRVVATLYPEETPPAVLAPVQPLFDTVSLTPQEGLDDVSSQAA